MDSFAPTHPPTYQSGSPTHLRVYPPTHQSGSPTDMNVKWFGEPDQKSVTTHPARLFLPLLNLEKEKSGKEKMKGRDCKEGCLMDSHPSVSPSHCSTEPFHPTHYRTAVIFVAKCWIAFLGWSVMLNTINTLQWLFLTPFWLATHSVLLFLSKYCK